VFAGLAGAVTRGPLRFPQQNALKAIGCPILPLQEGNDSGTLVAGNILMRVAALFAGIGGLELGLHQAGHETVVFSENWAPALPCLQSGLAEFRTKVTWQT
jgi:C-5 cytosine-specific DNA methylase